MKTTLIVHRGERLGAEIVRYLATRGYSTRQALNGQAALSDIRHCIEKNLPVDIVIAEGKMAPMNGMGLANQLEQRKINIPVILISDQSIAREILEQSSPFFVIQDKTGKIDLTELYEIMHMALYRRPQTE